MTMLDGLDLTVHVPAADWAFAQRRILYLETLLLRVLRDQDALREWWTAEELARLKLPGLPGSAAGIAQRATRANWTRRKQAGRYGYHFTSLPSGAFEALIAWILDAPPPEGSVEIHPDLPPVAMPPPIAENAAPPWVLPLMRLMKDNHDLGSAWQELPSHLPKGVLLPTVEEAATVLIRLGLA